MSEYAQHWFYGAPAAAEAGRAAMIAAGAGVFPPASEPVRIINPDDPPEKREGAFAAVLPADVPRPELPDLKRAAGGFGVPVLGTF